MDFYSNLNIFYQTSPNFEGKLTSFVPILAKNTCVCGCKPVIDYSKLNTSLLERFMKPGIETIDTFLLQPHHFLPNKYPSWGKPAKFCCCFGPKHMCAWFGTGAIPFQLQC